MDLNDILLSSDEKAIMALRALYRENGYSQFKMRKFEEYDLYARNKDFLISDNIITFTDTNGRLMALKPDVTLSIIKNTKDMSGVQKLYYTENVYRVSETTHAFQEIMQIGLECIGDVGRACILEVLTLAGESLKRMSDNFELDVSDLGILSELLDACGASYEGRKNILRCISEKNLHELADACASDGISTEKAELLKALASLRGRPAEVLPALERLLGGVIAEESLSGFRAIACELEERFGSGRVNIDFSVTDDMNYYNGIVFKGYLSDVPSRVLSGGQYDKLMKKMGRSSGAIGFAVYLDTLERLEKAESEVCEKKILNVALPKGRLGEKVYDMFEKAGFGCPSIRENSRKLIFENAEAGVRFFWVKPSDVAIYVERGAADIGVAGKDILLEYEPDVYELLDLGIGKCRMAVAAPKGFRDDTEKTLRVATKFTNIAQNYYSSIGRDIDIIHLNGSIEIAPILGLSDVIVDIVETGTTLKENDLEVIETVVPISARLIANKANSRFCGETIEKIVCSMAEQTEE